MTCWAGLHSSFPGPLGSLALESAAFSRRQGLLPCFTFHVKPACPFWGSQATSEPPESWMPRLHGGWTVLWLHFLFLGRSWLRRGPGSSVLDEGCLLKHTPLPSSSGSWESFSRYFSQRLSEGCDFSCCFTFPACWWPTFSSSPAPRVSSRDLSGSSETCPCSRFNFWTWRLQSAPEPSP